MTDDYVFEMTAEVLRLAMSLPQQFRSLVHDEQEGKTAEQVAERFDQFAAMFADIAGDFAEFAAWCRLGSAALRGQDVPLSIHWPKGEDPADTVRWQEWRVSGPNGEEKPQCLR